MDKTARRRQTVKSYRYALKVSAMFRLRTPLVIRTPSDEDYLDHKVERTPDDRLHINGYVWASLLRRAAERIDGLPDVFNKIGKYDGTMGVSPFWFESTIVPLRITDIRPGIRIDRRLGTAARGALYSEEIVPAGHKIPVDFMVFLENNDDVDEIVDSIEKIFHLIDDGIENIGGNWSYGYGRLRFLEGRYRVLMTCRGLRAAFDPIRNKYVAWVKKGENLKRLGELVNGKMRASVDQEFEKIVITAEEDGYANKPKGEALLTGKVEEIVFEGVEMPKEEVVKEIDETGDKGPISTSGKVGTGASVFKVLGKALLTGFLVLLGVVGVLSYLSRRKK